MRHICVIVQWDRYRPIGPMTNDSVYNDHDNCGFRGAVTINDFVPTMVCWFLPDANLRVQLSDPG